MRHWLASVTAVVVLGGAAAAYAPASSPRPQPRGVVAGDHGSDATADAVAASVAAASAPTAPARSLHPAPRPDRRPVRSASVARRAPAGAAICGNRDIRGESVARVTGNGDCGIARPVLVSSVSGVQLSTPALLDCDAAKALNRWVDRSVLDRIGRTGGGVTGLRVVAHYACRTRNSQPGAKLSEHARGRAIDIAAFQLANGTEISVLDDWDRGRPGRILKRLHDDACGPFGTVLGPDSDRHHQDHFHLDVASYRGGPYCR